MYDPEYPYRYEVLWNNIKLLTPVVFISNLFHLYRSAIEEGKAIFHNIRNFVRFQLST